MSAIKQTDFPIVFIGDIYKLGKHRVVIIGSDTGYKLLELLEDDDNQFVQSLLLQPWKSPNCRFNSFSDWRKAKNQLIDPIFRVNMFSGNAEVELDETNTESKPINPILHIDLTDLEECKSPFRMCGGIPVECNGGCPYHC